MHEIINKAREHIASDEIDEALEVLSNIEDTGVKDEAIILKGRITKMKKNVRLNVISAQDANIERLQVCYAVLEICKDIEKLKANVSTNLNNGVLILEHKGEEKKIKIGDKFENYKVIEFIRRSEFGELYQAKHMYLSKYVALMIAFPFTDKTGIVNQFIEYALKMIINSDNSNGVKITDAGISTYLGIERYFVVSELVNDFNLAEYIENKIISSLSFLMNKTIS
mgnify:CR=1 FL=1